MGPQEPIDLTKKNENRNFVSEHYVANIVCMKMNQPIVKMHRKPSTATCIVFKRLTVIEIGVSDCQAVAQES